MQCAGTFRRVYACAATKPGVFYCCKVEVDNASELMLRRMGAEGLITADHFAVRNDIDTIVLGTQNIELVKKMAWM